MEHSTDDLDALVSARMRYPAADDLRTALGDRPMNCDEHGAYTSSGARYLGSREIWTRCPDCEEARIAAERQEVANKKALAARLELDRMIDQASIPPRFIGRTFENFRATTEEQVDALQKSAAFADNFASHAKRGEGLVFSGSPGTGKSHLAAAILQAIMPAHCGMYITCMGAIRMIRSTWRKDSDRTEDEVLAILGGVPLLVLDEIGVQYGTDGEQTILFDVLDRRYRDMKPTILLTNQDTQGLKKFLGERSYDRIKETTRWISFQWASYRPQARKEAEA